MNRQQRRQAKHLPVDRHPRTGQRPQDLTSKQLRHRLVSDAVDGYPTPLLWFVAACERIARLDRISIDAAYTAVRAEIAAKGGTMPDAPGS